MDIEITKLIPQRPPFVMVEKLLFCDELTTKTSLFLKNDNIFSENGYFSQSGIIENVAQTCAARLGYLNINKPVKIGMIGSVNDFEIFALPEIGCEIITEIVVEAEIGNIILLNANVLCGADKVAQGKMKVILTDTEI
ncbi:MAG: pseudouridylate synthase [Prevotellaceae bacterium]|jgi:predicted hotdog family 3-hydroxylacyl-ACP dehydratase|nr:pseudouridylate synthase [Prevotellaceae bacterium]